MWASYVAAVGALALLTLLPGPDVAVVTRFALSGVAAAGARAAVGVVAGLAVWGALTVLGLAAVLAASATAYTVVKITGAVFLVAMGVRMLWRSRRQDGRPEKAPAGHPARSGLLTNLLNPKIAVFYTGLLPSLVPPGGSPHAWLPLLVATHVVLSLAWLLAYAAAMSRSRTVLGRPRVRTVRDRVAACVLIGFGVRVAAQVR
jgi:threonine/homoserine/homoserine lactone efflux protein